jgi:hypothetical protein
MLFAALVLFVVVVVWVVVMCPEMLGITVAVRQNSTRRGVNAVAL